MNAETPIRRVKTREEYFGAVLTPDQMKMVLRALQHEHGDTVCDLDDCPITPAIALLTERLKDAHL